MIVYQKLVNDDVSQVIARTVRLPDVFDPTIQARSIISILAFHVNTATRVTLGVIQSIDVDGEHIESATAMDGSSSFVLLTTNGTHLVARRFDLTGSSSFTVEKPIALARLPSSGQYHRRAATIVRGRQTAGIWFAAMQHLAVNDTDSNGVEIVAMSLDNAITWTLLTYTVTQRAVPFYANGFIERNDPSRLYRLWQSSAFDVRAQGMDLAVRAYTERPQQWLNLSARLFPGLGAPRLASHPSVGWAAVGAEVTEGAVWSLYDILVTCFSPPHCMMMLMMMNTSILLSYS